MPRHEQAMKDVPGCEKPRGAAKERRSADVRMGQPILRLTENMLRVIGAGEPAELKHLSRRRRREQVVIPQVVASERGEAQTAVASPPRGCRT